MFYPLRMIVLHSSKQEHVKVTEGSKNDLSKESTEAIGSDTTANITVA